MGKVRLFFVFQHYGVLYWLGCGSWGVKRDGNCDMDEFL